MVHVLYSYKTYTNNYIYEHTYDRTYSYMWNTGQHSYMWNTGEDSYVLNTGEHSYMSNTGKHATKSAQWHKILRLCLRTFNLIAGVPGFSWSLSLVPGY